MNVRHQSCRTGNVSAAARLKTMARRIAFTLVLLLSALPLLAAHHFIDFEAQPVPPGFGEADVKIGNVLFQGGRVQNTIEPRNTTHVYFTREYDYIAEYGLQPTIDLEFDQPAKNIEFDLENGVPATRHYSISDDQGGFKDITLPPFGKGDGSNIIHVKFSGQNVHALFISSTDAANGALYDFYIDNVAYDDNVAAQYAIVARLGDNPDDPNPPAPVEVTSSSTVRVPLGQSFSILLKSKQPDGSWADVPANFGLQAARPAGPAAEPGQSLFPDYVVFQYETTANVARREFQSVRLGTVPLLMFPNDPTLPIIQLTISSEMPSSLGDPATAPGGRQAQWDQVMSQQGSRRGIPPQFIKAIGYHESSDDPAHPFDIHDWRYEPGADRGVAPLRGASPYSLFRLDSPPSDGNYSLGAYICPQSINAGGCIFPDMNDVLPATALAYMRSGQTHPIPADPRGAFITIREICNGNTLQGWQRLGACPPITPPAPAPVPPPGRPRPTRPPDPFGSVATPHEAASYGIMQTTWYSVIEKFFLDDAPIFLGAQGHQNPSLLFDDAANLTRGTASVIIGPNELRTKFMRTNGLDQSITPNYDSPDGYRSDMRDAVRYYNGGGDAADNYADNLVMPLVPLFLGRFSNGLVIIAQCSGGPAVEGQVNSPTIAAGNAALLSVQFTDATHYQWYVGAPGDRSQPIPNSDISYIRVAPAVTTQYWVEGSNHCGTIFATGTVTVVTGCISPSVTTQPANQSITAGSPVTLTAAFSGTAPVIIQWLTGDNVAAGTGSSITITPAATTVYTARGSNICGSVTTSPVTVTVNPLPTCIAPSITAEPQDVTVAGGDPATLSLTASGSTPLDIEWFTTGGTSVGSGSSINVSPTQTTSYYATATNACGRARSRTVTVTWQCAAPQITSQPTGATIPAGASATLSAQASGTAPLTFTWYTAAGVVVATGSTASVTPAVTTSYYGVVSNACNSAQTSTVTVTVVPCGAPSITAQPQPSSIAPGDSATLTIGVTGASSITWFDAGGQVAGLGASITVSPAATTSYYALATNSCGTARSSDVTVTVTVQCVPPPALVSPFGASTTSGQNVTFFVSTDPEATYAWYEGTASDTSKLIGNSYYVSVAPLKTTSYWCRVTRAGCSSDSQTVTVTVCGPTIYQEPSDQTINYPNSATLSVGVIGDDTLTVQWYEGTVGDTSHLVGTGLSVVVSPVRTKSYWARAATACRSFDTPPVTITVAGCNDPSIYQPPQSQTINRGNTATLMVGAFGSNLTYQWYVSDPGGTAYVTAGTTSSITVAPTGSTAYYYVVISACERSVQSSIATITTLDCNTPPLITQQPQDVTFSAGGSATFSVAASGIGLTYQWYASDPSGSAYAVVPGATTTSLTITPNSSTATYFCRVTNQCGKVTDSQVATASQCEPSFIQQPQSQISTNPGHQSIFLAVSAQSDTNVTYQWYETTNIINASPIPGATGQFINVAPLQTTYYYCIATNACASTQSAYAVVTVCYPPVITSQPVAQQNVTPGNSVTLSVSASSPAGDSLRYQWYLGDFDPQALPGQTGPTMTFTPQFSGLYSVRVTNACTDTWSNYAEVDVVP